MCGMEVDAEEVLKIIGLLLIAGMATVCVMAPLATILRGRD